MSDIAASQNKRDAFGGSKYQSFSPRTLKPETKVINLVMSFEEALKLNLAVDACVHYLGRMNRSKASAKRAGLKLIIHFDKRRIRVQAGKLPSR